MIFIVEDDEDIREVERYALRGGGFEVTAFANAAEFFRALSETVPEIIILDIMLPGEDGMSILRKIKSSPRTAGVPVMMVTAKSSELDCVRGLDAGADDYVTKPFGVMEFLSRVRALMRRSTKEESPSSKVFSLGDVVLDDLRHIVTVQGEPCVLTFKEYELLKFLISRPGIVFSRETILEQVWECDPGFASRTVDMHVKTLRQKLGNSGSIIKTVRNVGYKAEL